MHHIRLDSIITSYNLLHFIAMSIPTPTSTYIIQLFLKINHYLTIAKKIQRVLDKLTSLLNLLREHRVLSHSMIVTFPKQTCSGRLQRYTICPQSRHPLSEKAPCPAQQLENPNGSRVKVKAQSASWASTLLVSPFDDICQLEKAHNKMTPPGRSFGSGHFCYIARWFLLKYFI